MSVAGSGRSSVFGDLERKRCSQMLNVAKLSGRYAEAVYFTVISVVSGERRLSIRGGGDGGMDVLTWLSVERRGIDTVRP